jgi:cytochrome c oxidase subunit 3
MQSQTIDVVNIVLNEEEKVAEAHHEEHHDYRLFGIFVFLFAEGMIFCGLFAAYLIFRATAIQWPPEGIERELLVPIINTVILISSSFVMNRGNAAIKKNDVAGLKLWLTLTAIMGIIFLGGQAYEYSQLPFGLTTNIYASSFYVMTGFHGLHVCFGVLVIGMVLLRSLKTGHYSSESHFGVEAAEIYWHFVDVIWVLLFLLLYIL